MITIPFMSVTALPGIKVDAICLIPSLLLWDKASRFSSGNLVQQTAGEFVLP